MRKKMLISFICILLVSWLLPIKSTMISRKNIKKYMEIGNTVLICEYQQITGPLWHVCECYGIENFPNEIEIVGKDIPFLRLRSAVYNNYYNDKFVFIGHFEDNGIIFNVDEWNVLGFKKSKMFPPYGFNLYEYKLKLDESEQQAYELDIRECVKRYQEDGII